MATEHIRFSELLTQHIENTVKRKFMHEMITDTVMREIRTLIRITIDNIFERSNHKLSPLGRAWLTDQFFKRIKVNNGQLMNDMVVIHEHKLSELVYDDVRLLSGLFDKTDLAHELHDEYRDRNAT